ncbi:hypothetical protein PS684_05461 [Pseudomonas fluorescens]|nr:hypothetical protein PS681_04004 [Pseudomonas fluorescens]VVN66128.1 hypothetical protein PS684_05461 [Pseudomonas fluorescens]
MLNSVAHLQGPFSGLGALFAGACLLLTPNSPSAAVWVALPVFSVWTAAFWPWALRLRHRVTALERICSSQPMEFCTFLSSSLLNCVRSSGPIARSLPVSVVICFWSSFGSRFCATLLTIPLPAAFKALLAAAKKLSAVARGSLRSWPRPTLALALASSRSPLASSRPRAVVSIPVAISLMICSPSLPASARIPGNLPLACSTKSSSVPMIEAFR